MCLNPKWIYKKGYYKENNYRGNEGDFYEIGTYSKCGCCEQCVAEKCNNWVIRNYYESKAHQEISFITLTYEENPVILVRKDLQDFMKRLRRYLDYHGYKKVRMFGAGEYGELNGRPHMHIILYGWTDKKPNYLTINKKGNIVYQSKIIQKLWGKGRTSYQEFNEHEIPYVAIYNTPQDEFKKAYKMTMEKAKTLRKYYENNRGLNKSTRKNAIAQLNEIEKEMSEKKEKYYMVKEFNTWSLALGWEKFYDEYSKSSDYTFTEYIEDKEFVTPTPWVKKLANMGDIKAAEEMKRREELIEQSASEEEERIKNLMKVQSRKKKDIMDWKDKKDEIEIL